MPVTRLTRVTLPVMPRVTTTASLTSLAGRVARMRTMVLGTSRQNWTRRLWTRRWLRLRISACKTLRWTLMSRPTMTLRTMSPPRCPTTWVG